MDFCCWVLFVVFLFAWFLIIVSTVMAFKPFSVTNSVIFISLVFKKHIIPKTDFYFLHQLVHIIRTLCSILNINWRTISKMWIYIHIFVANKQYSSKTVNSLAKTGVQNVLIASDFNIIFALFPSKNVVLILSSALKTAWEQEVKLCPFSAHASPTVLQLQLTEGKGKKKEGE